MNAFVVQSLSAVLEEVAAVPGEKHLAGNIKNLESLLVPDTLQRLSAEHRGAFAYLAFDPRGDAPVVEYLQEGTLADDSGRDVFCLFTLRVRAAMPRVIGSGTWDSLIEVDDTRQPASILVESLFLPKQPPVLPGVLVFGDLVSSQEAVFVSLAGADDARAVRQYLREVFSIAAGVVGESLAKGAGTHSFLDKFASALKRRHLAYVRTGRTSVQEWLIFAYQTAWAHREDILTVAKLVV